MTSLFVNSCISDTEKRDHVLLFPFLAKGHMIPLLYLATALCSRNVLVTLITTPANVPFVRHHLSSFSSSSNIRLLLLPFPFHPDLPVGVETTDALPSFSLFSTFLDATISLHDPFLLLLRRLFYSETPPLCLVSDFFYGWTLPICRGFGLPRLVFHGMSILSMSISKSLWNNPIMFTADVPFPVPGTPPSLLLNRADVPEAVLNSVDLHNPATQFLNLIGEMDVSSWGVIINSFAELEPPAYVELLESFYRSVAGGRMWLIGPLNILGSCEPESNSETECIRWLNRQPDRSVVYVAFGTQASVSDEQLDEVAYGMMQAGFRFLLTVRSETWVAPDAGCLGRIERSWVPQKQVLSHVAVGGFVSHCGWNSVMDAVAAGVALLALPMIAEQHLNAKQVAEQIGIGLRLAPASAAGVVGRKEVEEGVRELMGGESGRRARERAREVAKKARAAVVEGGSSYQTLEKLLDELRKVPKAPTAEDGLGEGDQNVEFGANEISCI